VKRLLLAGVALLTMASAVDALPRPPFRKVFIVVLENTSYEDALAQPFLGDLAARGALLTNFFAEARPSFPNYVALTAGSTYGIVSNADVTLDVPHVGDLIEATGRSWKAYGEGYPGHCFLGSQAGLYVRKHMPFVSFLNVQTNASRCARIVDASGLDADIANGTLPDYALYVPDLDNSGHDTGIAFADQWLAQAFGPRLEDPRFMDGMLFVVTFDEGAHGGPNHIYTVLHGPGVVPGSRSSSRYDHYSLLRTIEDVLGLGTLGQQDAAAPAIAGVWRRPLARDVDGDGRTDVLWRDTSGSLEVWLMRDVTVSAVRSLDRVGPEWTIAGIGDVDGDGRGDLLWRHPSGTVAVWLLDGASTVGSGVAGSAGPDWTVAGVGDFDGDGKADVLWRHTSGRVAAWLLDGATIVGAGVIGAVGADWAVAGIGDFDGDGKADVLWRHTSGRIAVWLLDGTRAAGSGMAGTAGPGWTLAGVGDFNGDGKADVLWRHVSGAVAVWLLDGTATVGAAVLGDVDTDWAIAGVGDFDGDGSTDILWRRQTSGAVAVWLLNGTAVAATGIAGIVAPGATIQ
jgi:hypothetical protein